MRHLRLISLLVGSGFITLWTITRSITNGVNFDVVGQIGVASQWAHGLHDGAQFGATNYALKLPLYFLVNSLDFIGPPAALLVLALLCNLAAFVAIFLLVEKLLQLYDLQPGRWFYLTAVWLAAISERVFWLDYANSRNLETAGGLLVLYLALRFWRQPSQRFAVLVSVISGAVFFADQLQLYIIGGGLLLFCMLQILLQRRRAIVYQASALMACLVVGYGVSRGLLLLLTSLLPVSFLVAPRAAEALGIGTLLQSLQGSFTSTMRILDIDFWTTGSVVNGLRQVVNLGLVVALLGGALYGLHRLQSTVRPLIAAAGCCIVASYVVYIASGQALQPQTERYLLMVPLLLVVGITAAGSSLPARLPRLHIPLLVGLLLSGALVAGALVVSWPSRYAKDVRITDITSYLERNNYTYALTSRDGIVTTYFSNNRLSVGPLICQPNRSLAASNLFFDQAGFEKAPSTVEVPLIVPAGGIVSSGSVCDDSAVVAQFGQPIRREPVGSGATAYIYNNINL